MEYVPDISSRGLIWKKIQSLLKFIFEHVYKWLIRICIFSSQFSGILRQIFILDQELGHASGSSLPKDFPPISERNTKMQIWEDLDKIEARFFMCRWIILFIIYFEKIGYWDGFKSFKMIKTVDSIQNIWASGWQPPIFTDYVRRERNVIISYPDLFSLVWNARFFLIVLLVFKKSERYNMSDLE